MSIGKYVWELRGQRGILSQLTNLLPLRLRSSLYCLACDNGAGPCKCFSSISWHISLAEGARGRGFSSCFLCAFPSLTPMVLCWCFSGHSGGHLPKKVPPNTQSWPSGDQHEFTSMYSFPTLAYINSRKHLYHPLKTSKVGNQLQGRRALFQIFPCVLCLGPGGSNCSLYLLFMYS